ncbi:magnesium transporter CorA family protein [Winogradskya consettensis]|uniref:magnesium transporter CorA family protein n=1 Tax=Winogradskya consettensis TaxID=113560 RepID=UPI001FD612FD|nr:magnesium transporter CorA family protein [Actinoplanes consettensis]
MDVWWVTEAQGAEKRDAGELPELLARPDGLVWVDIPQCWPGDEKVLREVFGFHPHAIRDCVHRNQVPKVHAYADHVFVVLHAPETGRNGHVHYIELDQFIGANYLVTVHGPTNEAVPARVALADTAGVMARIASGRYRPASGFDLSYAVVSALARRQEAFVEVQTREVWQLEQRVTGGHLGDPEKFLEEMFRTRHGLVAVRTMAALSREIYGRLATINRGVPERARPLLDDTVDQFNRVYAIADGQKDYLQGVIDFYRTRSDTKMTIAAERLAVIAVITLPITALSSVYGMNLIVNDSTHLGMLIPVLAVMLVMSVGLLIWAKRQGWW